MKVMRKKVLVYDNEVGYFNLLVKSLTDGFEFIFYTGQQVVDSFDIVAFFMHDNIEALDIARLYDAGKPFILAADNSHAGIKHENNMYVINTALPREDILKMLRKIFKELAQPAV
jgi:hypothetical protein